MLLLLVRDVLREILALLSIEDLVMCSRTCRLLHNEVLNTLTYYVFLEKRLRDDDRYEILFAALNEDQHTYLVRQFLQRYPILCECALTLAIWWGERQLAIRIWTEYPGLDGCVALKIASEAADIEMIEYFYDRRELYMYDLETPATSASALHLIAEAAALNGHLTVIKWLSEHRYDFKHVLSIAARNGQDQVFLMMTDGAVPFELLEDYAEGGLLDFLALALDTWRSLTQTTYETYGISRTNALRKAANNGHTNCVYLLLDHGALGFGSAVYSAIRTGDADLLQFMLSSTNWWTQEAEHYESMMRAAVRAAAHMGRLDLLDRFYCDKRYALQGVIGAARGGNLPLLQKFLKDDASALTELAAISTALDSGQLETAAKLLEVSRRPDYEIFSMHALQYLRDNRLPCFRSNVDAQSLWKLCTDLHYTPEEEEDFVEKVLDVALEWPVNVDILEYFYSLKKASLPMQGALSPHLLRCFTN